MLANLRERERERESKSRFVDIVMDFCYFLFFFVSTGFGWKRESKYGFVREKSRREKWVEGLKCWAERRQSSSSGASVQNPEKLKISTEASIYIQNSCEQNPEQPIFKPPPLSPSVFKPLPSPLPLSSTLSRERDQEVEIKVWRDLMGIVE